VADTEFGSGEIIKKCFEGKSNILKKYISHVPFHPSGGIYPIYPRVDTSMGLP